jgi:hypothetical protein
VIFDGVATIRSAPTGGNQVTGITLAVRKQVQQLSLDHDKEQYELVKEALNLMFEKYGKPPIA